MLGTQTPTTVRDVICVGAVNLDHLLLDQSTAGDSALAAVEPGEELVVGDASMDRVLGELDCSRVSTEVGGSAFNVSKMLARTRLGLRLGYVGVEGLLGNEDRAALRILSSLGIETEHLTPIPGARLGDCVSESDPAGRKLITCPRANVRAAEVLDEKLDRVAAYCASARIVHVTSFLDDSTPTVLAELVRRVRAQRPEVLISLDPGFEWVRALRQQGEWADGAVDGIRGLLAQTDLLFLNEREFQLLGARVGPTRDSVLAARIFDLARTDPLTPTPIRTVVVLKRSGATTLFEHDGLGPRVTLLEHTPLSSGDVVDDTGAGDVFAAGLLGGILWAESEPARFGARLGAAMAREKIQAYGDAGYRRAEAVARHGVESLDTEDVTPVARLRRASLNLCSTSEALELLAELARRIPRSYSPDPSDHEAGPRPPGSERELQLHLYRLLRWTFDGVEWELPSERRAGTAPRIDLVLAQHSIAIETKIIRDKVRPGAVADELLVDVGRYRASFAAMVAVVWDPRHRVADIARFEREFEMSAGEFPTRAVVVQP